MLFALYLPTLHNDQIWKRKTVYGNKKSIVIHKSWRTWTSKKVFSMYQYKGSIFYVLLVQRKYFLCISTTIISLCKYYSYTNDEDHLLLALYLFSFRFTFLALKQLSHVNPFDQMGSKCNTQIWCTFLPQSRHSTNLQCNTSIGWGMFKDQRQWWL